MLVQIYKSINQDYSKNTEILNDFMSCQFEDMVCASVWCKFETLGNPILFEY